MPNDQDTYFAVYSIKTKEGQIFYRQTREQTILSDSQSIIRTIFNDFNFRVTHAVVITYNDVTTKISETEKNTFQIVIAYNSQQSYVIMNYERLDTQHAIVGYNFPACTWRRFNALRSSTSMASTRNSLVVGRHVFPTDENCFQNFRGT